jgi:hypothetical protein
MNKRGQFTFLTLLRLSQLILIILFLIGPSNLRNGNIESAMSGIEVKVFSIIAPAKID